MLVRRTRLDRNHMGGAKCLATLAMQGQTGGAACHAPGNAFTLDRAACGSATPSRKRCIRDVALSRERAHFRLSLIPLSQLTTTAPAPSLLAVLSDPLTPALAHVVGGLLGRRASIREGARVLLRCGRKRHGRHPGGRAGSSRRRGCRGRGGRIAFNGRRCGAGIIKNSRPTWPVT